MAILKEHLKNVNLAWLRLATLSPPYARYLWKSVLIHRHSILICLLRRLEWGMGSASKAYRQLLLPLPFNPCKRDLLLENIYRLYNMRVRRIGISRSATSSGTRSTNYKKLKFIRFEAVVSCLFQCCLLFRFFFTGTIGSVHSGRGKWKATHCFHVHAHSSHHHSHHHPIHHLIGFTLTA